MVSAAPKLADQLGEKRMTEKKRMRAVVLTSLVVVAMTAATTGLLTRKPNDIADASRPSRGNDQESVGMDERGCFAIGKNGRSPFITVNVCGRTVKMLVDTGCSRTGLDSSFCFDLGVPVGNVEQQTFAGIIEAEVFNPPRFELAGLQHTPEGPIFCQDLSGLRKITGEDFWGIVGMDILHHYVMQIDFDEGMLRLGTSLPKEEASQGDGLKLKFVSEGCPSVPVKCGTLEREFVVDTGSTNTCLDQATFVRLESMGELIVGPSHHATSAGGLSASKSVLLSRLEVGPNTHENVLCDSDSMPALGLRYLSRYVVTFDFPGEMLYLRKGKRFSSPDSLGMTGIAPIRGLDDFVVSRLLPGSAADVAGIRIGDRIKRVNEQSTAEMDMFRMGKLLTGPPGQHLDLVIARDGKETKFDLVIQDRFANAKTGRTSGEDSIYGD